MKCDFYTITLSIITGVVASPISDLIQRTVVDEDSILSIPSPASALGMLDISEQKTTPSSDRRDKVRLDCSVQRRKSLIKKNNGDVAIYVPTCSPTDSVNYLAVQCLEVPKYCWCVHPATGEPIPGTSVLEAKPQCAEEEPKPKSRHGRKNRCSGKRRTRFLRRLLSAIKTEMIMTGNNVDENVNRETAIKWKFDQLNVNKNQLLERNEWKPYKNSIVQWKKVKHCSRNFFKTCDTDGNRKLTLDESGRNALILSCKRRQLFDRTSLILSCTF
ncbi:thyroglobulin type-1 repeat-containing domain protein [Cooperia oncophora]